MSDFILNILMIVVLTISSASYGYQVGRRKAEEQNKGERK